MAMVFADQGDKAGLETTYQRILELDPETQSVEDAAEWLETLMADLKELRQS